MSTKPKSKKAISRTHKPVLKESKPSVGKDKRVYFTVYVTAQQHELLVKFCKPLGVGVSTFMRQEALKAAQA